MKKIINVLIFSFLLLFNSCHKNDIIKKNDDNNDMVVKWKQSLILQGTRIELIDSVIQNIEISNFSTIALDNRGSLSLIETKEKTLDTKSFLGILNFNGKIISVGFIKTKAFSIEQASKIISEYVNHGSLSKETFIEVHKISGELLLREEKLSNGILKAQYRMALSQILSDQHTRTDYTLSVDPDPIGPPPLVCTDWYLVTYYNGAIISQDYVTTTCESGGGGGGRDSYIVGSGDHADDGKLSCRSFTFKSMTSNMYEAGISGLNFSIQIAGTSIALSYPYRNIYIGFPSKKANGEEYNTNEAAQYTASAMNRAALSMALKYAFYSEAEARALTSSSLEAEFKGLTLIILSNEIGAAATVSFQQSGNSTITNAAVWNTGWDILWNGLTGSGCN